MKTFVIAAAAAAALSLATSAHAGGYFGGSLGVTHASIDCAGTTSCDDNSAGGKFFGGYRFGPASGLGIGIELMAHDYGKPKATLDYFGSPASLKLRGTGFGAGVSFTGPFAPNWSVTARVGAASNKVKASATVGTLSATDSDTTTQAYYGFSVGWQFAPNIVLDMTLDGTRFKFIDQSYNSRMLGVGLTFNF
ncbi:MAG: outer membrane beta-barrel protein [Rubrivivax sp.]